MPVKSIACKMGILWFFGSNPEERLLRLLLYLLTRSNNTVAQNQRECETDEVLLESMMVDGMIKDYKLYCRTQV